MGKIKRCNLKILGWFRGNCVWLKWFVEWSIISC